MMMQKNSKKCTLHPLQGSIVSPLSHHHHRCNLQYPRGCFQLTLTWNFVFDWKWRWRCPMSASKGNGEGEKRMEDAMKMHKDAREGTDGGCGVGIACFIRFVFISIDTSKSPLHINWFGTLTDSIISSPSFLKSTIGTRIRNSVIAPKNKKKSCPILSSGVLIPR